MMQADILGERARLTPDRLALVVVEPPLRLTYRELDDRAVRCARLWTETLGFRKGDRVAILAHNRIEYLEAFFAAGKTGVILVTLGTRLTAVELAHIVHDCAPRAILHDGALDDTIADLRNRVTVEHWLALDMPEQSPRPVPIPRSSERGLASIEDGRSVFERSEVAEAAHRRCQTSNQPLSQGNDHDRSYSAEKKELSSDPTWQPTPCDGEDTYCLLYTSGTTGQPKGVMIPHRMVIANGFNTVCGWGLRADDVSSIFTPLYHAGGLMAFLVPLFVIGGTIVLHHDFDADEIWRTIEAERCTVVLGVPTIWKLLLECDAFENTDLSSLRWLISGGAPLPHYLADAYQTRGVTFKQGFGMTEVGVNCFAMTADDARRKVGSVGKPMMFTEVRLVDAEGHDVPSGEVGELWFRGPHVSKGYWNNPSATADTLDPDGWFKSGDQARRDDEGFYTIAGRQKDIIISGGANVYPAEIEAVLVQHPAIEDAAVVGVPDAHWGEVGIAFLVTRAGALDPDEIDADSLAAFLAERLARFKIPKAFRFLSELPRTAYGKVVKGDLRKAYLDTDASGQVAP